MLKIVQSKQFEKDLFLAKRRGLELELLEKVVNLIASESPLDISYRDHKLSGKFEGLRECHIKPDWLLIYSVDKELVELLLLRTGSHSDLFS